MDTIVKAKNEPVEVVPKEWPSNQYIIDIVSTPEIVDIGYQDILPHSGLWLSTLKQVLICTQWRYHKLIWWYILPFNWKILFLRTNFSSSTCILCVHDLKTHCYVHIAKIIYVARIVVPIINYNCWRTAKALLLLSPSTSIIDNLEIHKCMLLSTR